MPYCPVAHMHKQSEFLLNQQLPRAKYTAEVYILGLEAVQKNWDAPPTMQRPHALLNEPDFALPVSCCKKGASLLLVQASSLGSDS